MSLLPPKLATSSVYWLSFILRSASSSFSDHFPEDKRGTSSANTKCTRPPSHQFNATRYTQFNRNTRMQFPSTFRINVTRTAVIYYAILATGNKIRRGLYFIPKWEIYSREIDSNNGILLRNKYWHQLLVYKGIYILKRRSTASLWLAIMAVLWLISLCPQSNRASTFSKKPSTAAYTAYCVPV